MTDIQPIPTPDWQFDHFTLTAPSGDTAIAALVGLLGLSEGERPPFPFDGAWYYRGEQAWLHVIDAPGQRGPRFDHLAYRGTTPLADLMLMIAASGLPHDIQHLPATATAQVFVRLANDVVIELNVPAGEAVVADYPRRSGG